MTDLNALMNKDPLHLTTPEIKGIVQTLRKARHRYAREETDAKKAGRKPNHTKNLDGATLELDLDL